MCWWLMLTGCAGAAVGAAAGMLHAICTQQEPSQVSAQSQPSVQGMLLGKPIAMHVAWTALAAKSNVKMALARLAPLLVKHQMLVTG
jgi:uncharacterized membrane protein